jgi:hypothetical protein
MFDAMTGAGATTNAAMLGANASMFNNSQNNQTQQLNDLGNLGLGYGQLGINQQNSGIQNLINMGNYGNTAGIYNNSIPGQELGNMNSLFNQIPNYAPTPVDVTGAYGLQAGQQQNQYQGQLNAANATNQTEGQLGSAALIAAMMF